MPPRKRQKPSGLTGIIADAITDRQKAAESTKRLETQAEVAWARAAGKVEATEAKERIRQDEKAARERETEAGHAEAAAVTRALQGRVAELENLLESTLDEDPYLPFAQLKEPMPAARFRPPSHLTAETPRPELRLPEPPKGIGAFAKRRAYDQEAAQRRAEYEQDLAEHARAEHQRLDELARARGAHESATAEEKERVRRQHAVVDQQELDFAEGKPSAVAAYFREVLSVQSYPGDFPTGIRSVISPPPGSS